MKALHNITIAGILVVFAIAQANAGDTSTRTAARAPSGPNWVKPETDFSQYTKFRVMPLDISDVKVLKPVWEQDNPEEWEFTPGAGEAIQALYMDIISEELSKDGGYPVVANEGEDVLQLEVEFLSITPYVKPGTAADADKGFVISTLGSGDVVVSAELRDSVTGSLLMLVEGERKIGKEYKELSRENHIENLEATFRTWGRRLRGWLESTQKN